MSRSERLFTLLAALRRLPSPATAAQLARCCLRDDFRMFRAERIAAAAPTGDSFRPRRAALLRDYRARM